ncbi:unnamed protein product [Moneuplotes crassus]|uniref:Uncharacterized protein n=1 Tax=Euplotes crassus TaxID=5936 RepID=A0AAD1UKC6_EUPCR|nr:unnamed protein product [Moneuplotes crassus]
MEFNKDGAYQNVFGYYQNIVITNNPVGPSGTIGFLEAHEWKVTVEISEEFKDDSKQVRLYDETPYLSHPFEHCKDDFGIKKEEGSLTISDDEFFHKIESFEFQPNKILVNTINNVEELDHAKDTLDFIFLKHNKRNLHTSKSIQEIQDQKCVNLRGS